MIPNQKLHGGAITSPNFAGSRAYTFVDSYIYMKNRNYNALYEKNKEILLMENEAIKTNSIKILYDAFFEQMRILDTVVARMREFALKIKDDVISNVNIIMPDTETMLNFEQAISKIALLPKFKYVKYNIKPTEYADMSIFFNFFKNEIKEYCEIKDETSSISRPLLHSKATKFLTKLAIKYTNYSDSLLELEEIKIMTIQGLTNISNYFQKKYELKQMIVDDFKTYDYYLKQYKVLYNMTMLLKPDIFGNDAELNINGAKYRLSFNDYLVLYKHFSAMTKYLLDIVNYYNSKFFNKIYGIQSNIEVYRSIMIDVIDYSKNKDVESFNEATNSFNDLYGIINGNDAATELLMDDVNDYEQVLDDENDIKNDEIITSEKMSDIIDKEGDF